MPEEKVDYAIEPGSTTTEKTNEDYLWIGPEEGINAVLILDGTSGVKADFGANKNKTGGRRYVEKFGESVRKNLKKNPGIELDKVLKEAIKDVWKDFEQEACENTQKYFEGEDVVLQQASTIPAAVGAIIRWDEENLDLIHVGDVETLIETEEKTETFSNQTHENFDMIRDNYIEKYGEESEKVEEILIKHRSAHNLPGTYPNMSFNPLTVDKLGEKESYRIENVEKVLLSTDGAAPRIRKLMKPENNREIIKLIEQNNAQNTIQKLRQKERKTELNQLKTSDDAAIALIKFKK